MPNFNISWSVSVRLSFCKKRWQTAPYLHTPHRTFQRWFTGTDERFYDTTHRLADRFDKYSLEILKGNCWGLYDRITTPGVPMDFVAITVLCRIYHIHEVFSLTTEHGVHAEISIWNHHVSELSSMVTLSSLKQCIQDGQTSIMSGLFPEDSKGKCLHIHVQPCLDFLKTELLHSELPMEEEDDTVQDLQLDIKVKLPPKVERFVCDPVQKKIKIAKQNTACQTETWTIRSTIFCYPACHAYPACCAYTEYSCLKYGAAKETALYW